PGCDCAIAGAAAAPAATPAAALRRNARLFTVSSMQPDQLSFDSVVPPAFRTNDRVAVEGSGTDGRSRSQRQALVPGDGHALYQYRAALTGAAAYHVVTDRSDPLEHVLQVAGYGDLLHRVGDLPALHPESGGTARIVAGHRVDAVPHH